MSVAATVGALLPETVGETKTKLSGIDAVATAALRSWLILIKARSAWKGRSTGCFLKVISFSEASGMSPSAKLLLLLPKKLAILPEII